MNDTTAKPYFKTSYFWIMIASLVLGPPYLWLVGWLAPQISFLTETQRSQLTLNSYNGWLTILSITIGGNVAARGGVTFLKYLQPVLEAMRAKFPETVNAAGDVNVGITEKASSTRASPLSFNFKDEANAAPAFISDNGNQLDETPVSSGLSQTGETTLTDAAIDELIAGLRNRKGGGA